MAVLITKKTTGESLTAGPEAIDVVDVYQVSGVTNKEDAQNATGLPGYNSSHSRFGQALLRNRGVSGGPSLWDVACTYGIPVSGSWTPIATDPTSSDLKVRVRVGVVSEPSDIDADGLPLMKRGGGPIRPMPMVDKHILYIEARRYEKSWDGTKAVRISGAVNGDDLKIIGISFPTGMVKCTGYVIDNVDVTGKEKSVPVVYSFEARFWRENIGAHPHQLIVAETSEIGWATVGNTLTSGFLVRDPGTDNPASTAELAGEVPVDIDGKPIPSGIKVRIGPLLYTPEKADTTGYARPLVSRQSPSKQLITTRKTRRIIPFTREI